MRKYTLKANGTKSFLDTEYRMQQCYKYEEKLFYYLTIWSVLPLSTPVKGRAAGTMVVHSSSVRVIAHPNLSQVPPQHMHVVK